MPPVPWPPPVLGYHAMRLGGCRAALRDFLRRWGTHVFVAGAAAGGGAAVGVAAWLVLPLFAAAARPLWLPAAIVGHALVGAAWIAGLRLLLWPARWREAERALPVARALVLRSDAAVVAIALLPWALVCAVGAAALRGRPSGWPVGALALTASLALSMALGVALLQRRRVLARAGFSRSIEALPHPRAIEPAGAWRVLFWWPLRRGAARRSLRLLIAGTAVLMGPAAALAWRPRSGTACLAAFAALALPVATRLGTLLAEETRPRLEACRPLPLAATIGRRTMLGLALAPLAPGALLLAAALSRATMLRPTVLAVYAAACLVVCAVEARWPPDDPAVRSSRWLLGLALLLALASEATT